jgi:glucose/arabinose dehydrogenase
MADPVPDRRGLFTVPLPLLLVVLGCRAATTPNDPNGTNQLPLVQITAPAPGTSINAGDTLIFVGAATDPEDGVLAGASLVWSSSIDGSLGTGDSVVTTTLSAGTHTITLRASDSQGGFTDSMRSVTVIGPPGTLALEPVISGLSAPLFLTAPPGDTGRLFIVEQPGRIRIVKHGVLLATPFLDLTDSVSTGTEQGLLGLAFYPDYATSGRFIISYTSPHGSETGGTSVLARYQVSGAPDVADPASGVTLLTLDQPYSNHNGGMLAFGPDGYLYAGFGDGGGGGDPLPTGQDRRDLLGSMLRLDVSGNGAYTSPAGNPFDTSSVYRHELWNYGLRNPWRFSFDRQTGDLYIADVGQGAREEIDVQPAASSGGENYGWNTMEGFSCYNAPTCDQTGMALPVLDYGHGPACSVTGGYVYRGTRIPSLQGHYLYADYCGGWVRSFQWLGGQAMNQQNRTSLAPLHSITSFGEDAEGELYIIKQTGEVYRIVPQ